MKDELKLKKEQRIEKEDRFEALVKLAGGRKLTEEETAEMDALEAELKLLDTEIEKLEAREARAAKIAARKLSAEARAIGIDQDDESEVKELNKLSRRYKFANAFKAIHAKKNISGVELEMFQEASRESKEAGEDLQGNIAIPNRFIKIGKSNKRAALSVGTEGTDVVFTDYGGLIPILNPDPAVVGMGITVLQGLRGNVQWPRQTTDVAFSWETETSDVDETTPGFDNVSISPKRVGGYTDVTMQMLKQSVFVLEGWLRTIIERRYNLTVDYAVLNGSGTGNEPTGIFNAAGVGVFSTGSGGNSNDMNYRGLLSMIRDTKAAKARQGKAGWMTNAFGEFALATTPKQTSGVEGNFILNPEAGSLIGRKFISSEVIKSDFAEGSQTDLCGIVFSPNWSGAILGTWGGLDILFDPYTQAVGGKVRFVMNAFMDTDIEQPAEWSICKDWDASDLPALT